MIFYDMKPLLGYESPSASRSDLSEIPSFFAAAAKSSGFCPISPSALRSCCSVTPSFVAPAAKPIDGTDGIPPVGAVRLADGGAGGLPPWPVLLSAGTPDGIPPAGAGRVGWGAEGGWPVAGAVLLSAGVPEGAVLVPAGVVAGCAGAVAGCPGMGVG